MAQVITMGGLMNLFSVFFPFLILLLISVWVFKKRNVLTIQEVPLQDHISNSNLVEKAKKNLGLLSQQYIHPEVLEAGGMGVVFQAFDSERKRKVAIKTILPEFESEPEMIELFLRECQVIQAMNHPNVVRIFEVGQLENLRFYVMDFMEGENLQKIIDHEKHLPVATALKIGIQITRGLMHIHSNAIIHRDIKPANIFITRNQVAKILDFGVAKLFKAKSSLVDDKAGSPIYASPEQIQGQELTGKSDIYSLGICLYYMLCGQYPFPEGDLLAKMFQEPFPIKEINPQVSGPLAQIIHLCLERDLSKRLSARELWARLRAVSG